MEAKIGLSPVVMDIVAKTSPTLDELVFGSTVILLLNYLVLRHLLKKEVPLWKHLVIMLCSDCAFLINNFVKIYARRFYGPAIGTYGIAFFVIYYLLMYKTPGKKALSYEILPGFVMGLFYTFGVIAFEGFWRVGFWAQNLSILFTNPQVTFFRSFLIAVACAVAAWVLERVFRKKKRGNG
ncbi:MAG: hypothetical protein IJT62_01340 [Oscillospiraceae bacterium]|nr:hypothetical protein [Oscillospiraceae bacterium]